VLIDNPYVWKIKELNIGMKENFVEVHTRAVIFNEDNEILVARARK
jgi:hypothetical protein